MDPQPDRERMREATRLALRGVARNQGGPFGALVVRGGQVVGRGFNRVLATNDPTAHAEVVAIRQACRKLATFELRGCEIYASCEPCPMCLAAIHWARLDRVWYACDRDDAARAGFDDALLYAQIATPPAERLVPAQQVFREEGTAAFDAWRAKPDRVPY